MFKVCFALLVMALFAAVNCTQQSNITAENKALVFNSLDELYNKGDLHLADKFYAAEYIWHNVSGPDVHGADGMRQHVTLVRNAFPDINIIAEDMIAEGDKVVTRWTIKGTHKGELMGIPPTDSNVTFTGILISRIADGKIVEDWENSDVLGMLQQMGVIP